MNDKFYIKKIIRDDGVWLDFDDREILLDVDNTLVVRPNPDTSAVDYTEVNGGEMIAQRLTTFDQTINGLILPRETSYWQLVRSLTSFFQINHTYKIIYIEKDGTMFSVDNAWISEGLQIPPIASEQYAHWNITFTIGTDVLREYAENPSGEEVYANSVIVPLATNAIGGEKWDDIGLVADNVGEVWLGGDGGIQSIMINSAKTIYPVWEVSGPCAKPTLQNDTTDTAATYNGNLAVGQKLTVNFETGEAWVDGSLVSRLVSGVVTCEPGENLIGFNTEGGLTTESVIKWNNVIG